MTVNGFGPGVSRYLDDRDKQFAAVVFELNKPPCDAELNLISMIDLEARAETVRAMCPSGWFMDVNNPFSSYVTNPNYSNLFYFGRNATGELRNFEIANVNGWVIPVAGTRTGTPPLAPDDVDAWNAIELNPPSSTPGPNTLEFVFLEVWLARLDKDPAPPAIAPGKPQRGSVWKFGNAEGGFSFLPDGIVDPDLNFETTRRVQVQYRIRVVQSVNIATYPDGFDPSLVFAQGMLSIPSTVPFTNMRTTLEDPGLWRAGTGDPSTFGTVDGYVYAIPMTGVFRRNSTAFDVNNLTGAFNRNSAALDRTGATAYTTDIYTQAPVLLADATIVLTSIAGTILSTMTSDFSGAYFKIDDEIVQVTSIVQTGPTAYNINITRGVLNTAIRTHNSSVKLTPYTTRPDGLYSDQIAINDIMDLRHAVSSSFDYNSLLKTNLTELLKGNLRTSWKIGGPGQSRGSLVLYGDSVNNTESTSAYITELDTSNGNRRMFSDAVTTERYTVAATVLNTDFTVPISVTKSVSPYTIEAIFNSCITTTGRNPGSIYQWFNGDVIRIKLSDFQQGLPTIDADQVRFVLPSEDPNAVLIRFEGMTTDPNGGIPVTSSSSPSATPPFTTILTGNAILSSDVGNTGSGGLQVNLDPLGSGDLLITLCSGVSGSVLAEFTDALSGFSPPSEALAEQTLMHIEFSVVMGAGRGLSHKPKFIHTVNYIGDSPTIMLRSGLSSPSSKMIPTYIGDSPLVQTGVNRTLSRTSEIMIDPGSKTVYVAPYQNILTPVLLVRNGQYLNWYNNGLSFQGPMPTKDVSGVHTVHSVIDPLHLFNSSGDTRYIEIQSELLMRPGLHHIPIIPFTTTSFPSGLNFFMMSKEGPFTSNANNSNWNRDIVAYPSANPGYYIVTPKSGETYGTSSGTTSVFGQKYTNNKITSANGGAFKGIMFPPYLAPARITAVYWRQAVEVLPTPGSAFDNNRVLKSFDPSTCAINLLRDDCDAATVLLDVDADGQFGSYNGDVVFILSADAIDVSKLGDPSKTFDNCDFLVECTLFGFDRGFLQTNNRLVTVNNLNYAATPAVNAFTTESDNLVGIITTAPLSSDAGGGSTDQVNIYYSSQPYQGDVFGTQGSYSDVTYLAGPQTLNAAQTIANNPVDVTQLALNNVGGYEVLASTAFVTSLGTGRLSGSTPIPLLSVASNPNAVVDYAGTLIDLDRRFSLNRVGYESWNDQKYKYPVQVAKASIRPNLMRGAMDEVYDRDLHPEFAGCVSNLPLGAYFRDKDFVGKMLYQSRSFTGSAITPLGTLTFPQFMSSKSSPVASKSTWEGTEFVCGNASNVNGCGGESLVKADASNPPGYGDVTKFKTARGAAAWSVTNPWSGSEIATEIVKARPNIEAGSILAGVAYLVKSQPEVQQSTTNEWHSGHELQLFIVTEAIPSYFRDTEVVHSITGVNEGYTAADRFRIWGRPLEKKRGGVNTSIVPSGKPVFVNNVWDDPILFGSSDLPLEANKQETLPVISDGQTTFSLSYRPLDPTTVMAWLNGNKLQYDIDYIVTGGPTYQTLIYNPTLVPPALTIKLGDILEVYYAVL